MIKKLRKELEHIASISELCKNERQELENYVEELLKGELSI